MEVTEVRREVIEIEAKSLIITLILIAIFGLTFSMYIEYSEVMYNYNQNVESQLNNLRSELITYANPLLQTDQKPLVEKIENRILNTTDLTELDYCFVDLKAIYSYTGTEPDTNTGAEIYLALTYYDIALKNRWDTICHSVYSFFFNDICSDKRYI